MKEKKYSFYANLNHNETGKESVRLGYSSVVEIVAKGENLLGEIKILSNPYIEKKYENGILSFDKISVKNPDCLGDVICEVFDGRWGWQGAYKGEFADDSVSFDFSDANLKFFDKSRRRNGTFFFTTQFIILNQDMEKKVQMIIIPISNLYKKNKKNIKKSGFKVLTHPCDMRYINVHLRRQAASFLKGIYQGWTAKARNACRRAVLSVCVIGGQIREDERAF